MWWGARRGGYAGQPAVLPRPERSDAGCLQAAAPRVPVLVITHIWGQAPRAPYHARMNSSPETVLCPICGSPLSLDSAVAGACQSCHGHVSFAEPVDSPFTPRTGQTGLVPQGLDFAVVAPFIYLTLATLGMLSGDPVVQQYASAEPQAQHAIRELSRAVAAAGTRVRDTGQMRDSFDENLRYYTAEEIWLFNLAIDVIAMLGTLGGLPPGTRARIIDDLKSLDGNVHSHHWQKEVRQAGDGPARFRELRAHVPHRQPHPGR